jgi:hypothetical protein
VLHDRADRLQQRDHGTPIGVMAHGDAGRAGVACCGDGCRGAPALSPVTSMLLSAPAAVARSRGSVRTKGLLPRPEGAREQARPARDAATGGIAPAAGTLIASCAGAAGRLAVASSLVGGGVRCVRSASVKASRRCRPGGPGPRRRAFPAGGFRQRQVRLDLVTVAAAVLLLDDVAGLGQAGDDTVGAAPGDAQAGPMSRSRIPGSCAMHSSTRAWLVRKASSPRSKQATKFWKSVASFLTQA